MGNQNSIQRVNFEDIQYIIMNKDTYCIINTLDGKNQGCLIPNTITCDQEETILNHLLVNNLEQPVVIYGANVNDHSVYDKYDQLSKLGFKRLYIYPGGIFEWLCLQDIYSHELFPTTKKELDLLKYKPVSVLHTNGYYLTNN